MGNVFLRKCLKYRDNDKFQKFTLNNYSTYCKILSVYDGDTCTIGFKWHDGTYYNTRVRMMGHDSPEMKPRLNVKNRDKVIIKAHKAKEFLLDLTANKILWVEFGDFDKYGRPLAKLYTENRNCCIPCIYSREEVNQKMLDNGHGYEYFGGTKK